MAQKTNPFYDFISSSFGQIVVTAILMLFLFGTSAFIAYKTNKPERPSPTSFEECLNYPGSIIQESYPEICVTPDGMRYIQRTPREQPQFDDPLSYEECLKESGVWQKWGLAGLEYCQIPAYDSDKDCTDGAQCSLGGCISDDGTLPGKCQKFKNTFGCFSYVEDGKVINALCID